MSNSWRASLQQNYSKLDDDRAWSSQEWKTEATACDRSGRPDKTSWRMVRKNRPDHEEILLDGTAQSLRNEEALRDRSGRPDNINSQEVAKLQNFVMGNDETELELSVESRSFVNRVNDQVRKRQKRISNVAGDGEEHSMILVMFMSVTMESAVFMGKNFQNNQNSIVNTADLTLKQMFDKSAKLVAEQSDEIYGVNTINWEDSSWKYLSLIGDEQIVTQVWKRLVGKNIHGNICHYLVMKESSIFNARKSTSFQILYCVLERSIKIRNPTKLGRKG